MLIFEYDKNDCFRLRQKQREEEIKQDRENLFLEHVKNLNEIDVK